jgi:D-3-phosphoglycerate dehydrogenase
MQILAHDHHPTDHMDFLPGVRLCDLTTLLRQSDVISLNCTLNPESENLINADTLNQMQRKPILINCARGELVDEDALAVALDTGRISAAGLDVLRDEPPDLKTSKLAGRDNVIITPHVAFYSDASILESRRISATNVRNFLDGHHELVDRYVYNHAGQ